MFGTWQALQASCVNRFLPDFAAGVRTSGGRRREQAHEVREPVDVGLPGRRIDGILGVAHLIV